MTNIRGFFFTQFLFSCVVNIAVSEKSCSIFVAKSREIKLSIVQNWSISLHCSLNCCFPVYRTAQFYTITCGSALQFIRLETYENIRINLFLVKQLLLARSHKTHSIPRIYVFCPIPQCHSFKAAEVKQPLYILRYLLSLYSQCTMSHVATLKMYTTAVTRLLLGILLEFISTNENETLQSRNLDEDSAKTTCTDNQRVYIATRDLSR